MKFYSHQIYLVKVIKLFVSIHYGVSAFFIGLKNMHIKYLILFNSLKEI